VEELEIAPSKFITTCQSARLTVTASDTEGDSLSYQWSIKRAPQDSVDAAIEGEAQGATFTPDVAGDYHLRVQVFDSHEASTAVRFPMHVAAAKCEEGGDGVGGASGDEGVGGASVDEDADDSAGASGRAGNPAEADGGAAGRRPTDDDQPKGKGKPKDQP
jgi:hypothetical protein